MVILMCRRSPARRGLGADAPQILQRTAELIPNQLKFSALPTLHPWGLARRIPFGRTALRGLPALLVVDGFGRAIVFIEPGLVVVISRSDPLFTSIYLIDGRPAHPREYQRGDDDGHSTSIERWA